MRYYVLNSEDMKKLNNNELVTFPDPNTKTRCAICTSEAYIKATTIQQESQEEKP